MGEGIGDVSHAPFLLFGPKRRIPPLEDNKFLDHREWNGKELIHSLLKLLAFLGFG